MGGPGAIQSGGQESHDASSAVAWVAAWVTAELAAAEMFLEMNVDDAAKAPQAAEHPRVVLDRLDGVLTALR